MLNQWKRAWKEAVENFWRELRAEEDAGAGTGLGSLRRELASASEEVRRLDAELERTRRELAAEREQEATCRRREGLAREIGDLETARIAAGFAQRHAERAAILARKVEVLEAEHAIRLRDLAEMETVLQQRPATATTPPDPLDDPADALFRTLEREARDRAAEQRLQELKRRMS